MSASKKVILITRRTRLQDLIAQYNTQGQAAFVIESRGLNFQEYREENDTYLKAVKTVESQLQCDVRVQKLERDFLPNFILSPDDIVVVVGQDGLVANTLKYLNGQPVIAINPEPNRYDGVLLPFNVDDIQTVVKDVIRGVFKHKVITMAKAVMNDGQELIAVNDFFIGPRYQISARYELTVGKKSETQSSSGIIVSTGLGSTGWMKSILAGAQGVIGKSTSIESMAWDSDCLQFAVREPFPSQTTGTELVFGKVTPRSAMKITSQMANNGVIFSDGMIDDFIEFNSGMVGEISVSEKIGRLVQ